MNPLTPIRGVLLLAAAVLALGCGGDLCDRSSKSTAGKTGDCAGETFEALGASCSGAQASCKGDDQKILGEVVDCFEKLPVCASASVDEWRGSRSACYARAEALSEGCRGALFEGGVLPGTDAGVDGGSEEDLPQPDTDGGGALDLIAVADENDFALAWTRRQPGPVAGWDLHSENSLAIRLPVLHVSDPNAQFLSIPDAGAGARRSFFLWGLGSDGGAEYGRPGTGGGSDGGTGGCTVNTDCALDRVCDLSQCKPLSCTATNFCPVGYVCDTINTHICHRQYNPDGGTAVVTSDAGEQEAPRPFISEAVEALTGAPSFAERPVSIFPADQDPDLAGIDSARQAVVVQQFGQIFLHLTEDRGRTWRATAIDPVGQGPRVAYNKDSRQLFVCYQAGSVVRVRSSLDLGKTWLPTVGEIASPTPTDGGASSPITNCDIAAWRSGGAIVAVVEDTGIVTYDVTSGVGVGSAAPAYVNEAPGSTTTVYAAARPAIATLPDESIVHVAFTGTRQLAGGTSERDVYGVYRDPARTAGLFSARMRISGGTGQGQILDQDYVTLALEPGSGRAVAAFQSEETGTTGGTYQSVYLALFAKPGAATSYSWGTGADLNVFAKTSSNTYAVVTDRQNDGSIWNAVNPSVAVLGNGKGLLAFGLSQTGQPAALYTVGFSFTAQSPIGGIGWFAPPAVKASTTPIYEVGNSSRRVGPVLSGDQQLSAYVTFIEGVGGGATQPNRPILVTRPQ